MTYSILITLVLMNLVISILSDRYELVMAEFNYYNGKAKLQKSIAYERLIMFLQNCFCKTKEQSYHYLFITKPLTIEEDRNDEWDGMTGTVLKAVRINHKTVSE